MRFLELSYNGDRIVSQVKITNILEELGFNWLIDSEIENAKIEIRKKTLIWHDGIYYSGHWEYGIFKNGEFYGIFENGIFENGNFGGKFLSGINLV